MTVHVINPNHPATQLDADMYRKFLAMVVRKYCPGARAVITTDDVKTVDGIVLATAYHAESIEFFITNEAEAQRIAREAGGMPN